MKKKLRFILLIDDDEATNFINSIIIREAACTEHIEVAQTGWEALEFLTGNGQLTGDAAWQAGKALILLDINMPAMNGWEFLEKYNGLGIAQKSNTSIVMLTTSQNPEDEINAKKNKLILGYRYKPLTKMKLEQILQEYFPDYRE